MAKKMKKVLGVLMSCMLLATSIIAPALADEITTSVDEATGETLTVTTTTTSEDGKNTVTVTWSNEEPAEGEEAPAVEIDGSETTVTTATSTEVSGSETRVSDVEDNGDEPGQPEVSVNLVPGSETTASGEVITVTGDEPKDENDQNYDYTVTTTTERVVEATTGDITYTEDNTTGVYMESVMPENYEGKTLIKPDDFGPASAVNKYCDTVTVIDENGEEATRWVPRFVRTNEEMPEFLKEYYDYNEETQLWTPRGTKTILDNPTWDYVFAENGEYSQAGVAVHKKTSDWSTGSRQFVLYSKDGDRVYAYCMDMLTGTTTNYKYDVENLDEADYFEDPEAKEHIRAIAQNGYWGTEESFTELQEGLIEALNNGLEIKFEFDDGSVHYSYDSTTEEGRAILLDLAANINEGEALSATQGAIWFFGRDSEAFWGFNPFRANAPDSYKDEQGLWRYTHGGPEARMILIYEYLKTLTADQDETVVIDKNNFLDEESLALVIGDKVSEHEQNKDDNKDNDVYESALSFKLAFIPGENDDLLVCLMDADNNPIVDKDGNAIIRRLAGENGADENYETITADENGVYILSGLQLGENSEFEFDLRLEGTQYLEKGVYIYKASGGDYDDWQTLVGVAEGKQDVSVGATFTVSFDVDESNHVVAERVWHRTSIETRPGDRKNPPAPATTVIDDEGVPMAASADELIEIIDEEVPLADAPKTGDNSIIYVLMSLISLCGLTLVAMKRKAIKEN